MKNTLIKEEDFEANKRRILDRDKKIFLDQELSKDWVNYNVMPAGEYLQMCGYKILFNGCAWSGDWKMTKGIKYPTRTFTVRFSDSTNEEDTRDIVISLDSYFETLDLDNPEDDDMDCEIYYYVPDDLFFKSGEEICKDLLDEEMTFVEEL